MAHICGHPTLPRLTTPPEYDPADIQPGEDRVPGTLKSNSSTMPEKPDAQSEAQTQTVEGNAAVASAAADGAASAQNEKAETNEEAIEDKAAGRGATVSEKSVQIVAKRIPSSSSDVQPSRPVGSISNDNNNNGNGNGVDGRNDQINCNDSPASNEPPAILEVPEAHEEQQAQQAQETQHAPDNEQAADAAPLGQQELPEEAAALQPAQESQQPAILQAAAVHNQNNPPRHSLREWLLFMRQKRPGTDPFKDSPQPIGSFRTDDYDDYDILAGLMTRGKVPSQVPKYMNMAFPRTVDLSVPCSYCFMMLDTYMRETGDHIRSRPKIRRVKKSRIPGKRIAVLGTKYLCAYSFYAVSTVLRAVTVGLDDFFSGKGKLTELEEDRLQAYFDAMYDARSLSFHVWWAVQEPATGPAVMAKGHDGLYYSYGYYR